MPETLLVDDRPVVVRARRTLSRQSTLLGLLVLAFVAVSLYVLRVRVLVPPDEGRYAEMAREMFASGDWITTRLNGIKYFEKPPLQTWMTALAFSAFGLGEWQARLWTGLCGLLGVGLVGFTGARLFGRRAGAYAALALGSCFYWAACSQIDSLDMGLSAMMTVALCGLLLAQRDGIPAAARRHWMLVCWTGMALAVLSKGLIGIVLPAGVLLVYAAAAGDRAVLARLHPVCGLALFLLIAAPWFVLVALRNPEQPHFFFIHEHVERFLLKEHHREAAWWTFPALLAIGSLPWPWILVRSLAAALRRRAGAFQPRKLLLAWVAFILLFFTLSSSKLPGYILPVFPAVALLAGDWLAAASRRDLAANAAVLPVLGLGLLGVAPFAAQFGRRAGEAAQFATCAPWIAGVGLVALIGGALALRHALWQRPAQQSAQQSAHQSAQHSAQQAQDTARDRSVLALALAGFACTQLLLAGFAPIAQLRAGTGLLPATRAALTPATRVYSVGIYEQSLTFYLQHTVVLADYRDEFDFGLRQEPALALDTVDDFMDRWQADTQAGRPALAIVRNDLLPELRRAGVALHVVAADTRRTVIANRAAATSGKAVTNRAGCATAPCAAAGTSA